MTTRLELRLAAGLCKMCGGNPGPGRKTCRPCNQAHYSRYKKAKLRKERKRRIASGLCSRCGGARDDDRSWCSACRRAYREIRSRRFAKRHAESKCSRCGRGETIRSQKIARCFGCWLTHTAVVYGLKRSDIAALWSEQGGRCAYSGEVIHPGGRQADSAEIDHKTPRSRGGGPEKKNLHWVSRKMNIAKGTRTHDEFVAICTSVAKGA